MVRAESGGNRKIIELPLSAEDVASLTAGELVLINGRLITGRDRVHKYLVEQKPGRTDVPFDLAGSIVYHCGPIVTKKDGEYKIVAAGPTTSMRVEMYEADVIKAFTLRGIMGKGGMGENTRAALKECGAVYFHAAGGAAVYLADRIAHVRGSWLLDEFGPTEAMWQLEVRNFPAVVTMDSRGNDIHRDIEKMSFQKFIEIIGK